jgi:hypothetical protein
MGYGNCDSYACPGFGLVTIWRKKCAELSAGAEIAAAATKKISFTCGTIAWKSGLPENGIKRYGYTEYQTRRGNAWCRSFGNRTDRDAMLSFNHEN